MIVPRSVRKVNTPKITVPKVPLEELEKPEDIISEDKLNSNKYAKDAKKRQQHILKEDDNGNRGERHVITCVCCGRPKYEDYFYINRVSYLFVGIWNRIPICKDCLDSLYRRYALQYDQLASAAAICAIVDLPFNESLARTQFEDGNFKIGNYVRGQNISVIAGKKFIDSIVSGEFFDAKDKVKVETEKLWESQDRKNKKFVISKFGYDPFDSFGLDDCDYRMAFNITAKYLEDESIVQDAHKMQSLVTMIMTMIQSNKVETLLTYQYKNIKPDTNEIKTLTATKRDIQATISKIAEDNNISSKYQKENRSAQNHLTAKMKEMSNNEYWEAKPNMFDVRTSAAMRQVADLSHQSIMEQLELTDSDYANMVKEQREMIKTLQEKCDRLEEENRNWANRFIAEASDGGKK